MILRITLAAMALVIGCQPSLADAPKGEPSEPPAPKRFEQDMMVRFHMHENFDLLRAIERLLIRGQLDEAKRFAAAIAQAPDEAGLGSWTAHAIVVRERAATLARAKTVGEGCRLVANLAAACAGCHVDAAVLPQLRVYPAAPADRPTIEARMARHRWAADRMWEGIVVGADEPWRAGLDVLAAAPLDWKEISPKRARFGRELERQAEQARRRKPNDSLTDRATAYGEILATCAGCHTTKTTAPRPVRAGSIR